MIEFVVGIGVGVLWGVIFRARWRRVTTTRLDRTMWDSSVEGWVSDGVSKGYALRAGSHLAYDGHTKVHMLVVQSSAVKKLREPELADREIYPSAGAQIAARQEWRKDRGR